MCIEKGGIPIMNWNNSKLKRCDFPPSNLIFKNLPAQK